MNLSNLWFRFFRKDRKCLFCMKILMPSTIMGVFECEIFLVCHTCAEFFQPDKAFKILLGQTTHKSNFPIPE